MTRSGRELGDLFDWKTPREYIESFRKGIAKLGWNSRPGKIPDYSNPKFEEAPLHVMKINLPKKFRDPFAWVMRVGAATPSAGAPEIKKLLESVAEKAFPADSNEEIGRDAHHICRMLMDSKTIESYCDKEQQKPAAGIGDRRIRSNF
jgi:hypothetical protein